jgi:DNA repair ATPase RecN
MEALKQMQLKEPEAYERMDNELKRQNEILQRTMITIDKILEEKQRKIEELEMENADLERIDEAHCHVVDDYENTIDKLIEKRDELIEENNALHKRVKDLSEQIIEVYKTVAEYEDWSVEDHLDRMKEKMELVEKLMGKNDLG